MPLHVLERKDMSFVWSLQDWSWTGQTPQVTVDEDTPQQLHMNELFLNAPGLSLQTRMVEEVGPLPVLRSENNELVQTTESSDPNIGSLQIQMRGGKNVEFTALNYPIAYFDGEEQRLTVYELGTQNQTLVTAIEMDVTMRRVGAGRPAHQPEAQNNKNTIITANSNKYCRVQKGIAQKCTLIDQNRKLTPPFVPHVPTTCTRESKHVGIKHDGLQDRLNRKMAIETSHKKRSVKPQQSSFNVLRILMMRGHKAQHQVMLDNGSSNFKQGAGNPEERLLWVLRMTREEDQRYGREDEKGHLENSTLPHSTT
ncbi:hypothetical protein C8J57DRAFT_1212071 [Mycena rebaudengoi]|nr:hypothetical protein C8J57DRAFT_1212071 [Mycena rebaudengoi]